MGWKRGHHPLNEAEARKRVREIVHADAGIIYTGHADEELSKDRIGRADVRFVLKAGAIVAPPIWNDGRGNWECEVQGPDLDGCRIRIVVGIWEKDEKLVIITGYRLE